MTMTMIHKIRRMLWWLFVLLLWNHDILPKNICCSAFVLLGTNSVPPRRRRRVVPMIKRRILYCRCWSSSSSSTSLHNNNDIDTVKIYDNVLSVDTCELLDELAQEYEENRGGIHGSSIFYRRDTNNNMEGKYITPIEHALHSILTAIGDNNTIVEYWSRQEYMNLDVHSDIDEVELEDDGKLRYPQYGHVLYLQVDNDLRGPTCIFPTQLGKWENSSGEGGEERCPLITVPAVQGRVVRFPGSAMHAVPKPSTRWFGFNDDDENNIDSDYDDDDDDDDNDVDTRSVILFNTWKDRGPRGVTEDSITGELPEGIEIDIDGSAIDVDSNDNYQEQQIAQQIADWEEEYGRNCKDLWCNERTHWKDVSIRTVEPVDENCSGVCNTYSSIRIPLMGSKSRRIHSQKYQTNIQAPTNLKSLLEEEKYQPYISLLKFSTTPDSAS